MIWIDFIVARLFSPEHIRTALARTLGMVESDVEVTDCIMHASSSTRYLAELAQLGGDFPLRVNLYVSSDQPPGDSTQFLEGLSRELKEDILTSDDSADPYSMLLISPNGKTRSVDLDVTSIDEYNEYRLAR